MTGFGSSLKAERERCGLTLDTISVQTKVSVRHLQALETESFAELPGGVFRRGIVRAYIAALGLEETPWMEKFQTSHDTFARRTGTQPEPEAWETFAENVKRSRIRSPRTFDLRWLWVLLMLVVLIAAAWAVWHYILQSRLQP